MELIIEDAELNKEQAAPVRSDADMAILEEMMKAGLFLGKRKSKTHPKMKDYIFGLRNEIAIIDLERTLECLNAAAEFVKAKIAGKATILLVGTTPSIKKLIEETAQRLKFPFVSERWLGGTLTNYNTISKRVAYFKKLKSNKETGRLDKYTKKERLDFDRQIQKMTMMFAGVEDMGKLPDILFVVDANEHLTAVREARRLKIPIVAVLNTDADLESVQYPIPANDRSRSSVEWILKRLEKAVEEGRAQAKETVKVEEKNVSTDN